MYRIVSACEEYLGNAIDKLEAEVNKLKQQGWVEQGGVSISHSVVNIPAPYPKPSTHHFYLVAQAMVKNEK